MTTNHITTVKPHIQFSPTAEQEQQADSQTDSLESAQAVRQICVYLPEAPASTWQSSLMNELCRRLVFIPALQERVSGEYYVLMSKPPAIWACGGEVKVEDDDDDDDYDASGIIRQQ